MKKQTRTKIPKNVSRVINVATGEIKIVKYPEDKCNCHQCVTDRKEGGVFFVVCSKCGNKRCPKASDHKLSCTNSNEPGQTGSAYE